ncbi:MAG: hypothetical protein EOL89_03260 [Actinobacteria bacterium]|nr:hypothetical protein [Actinomycetota bacterium]
MPIRIPAPNAAAVEVRIARIEDRDRFGERWQYHPLTRGADGWWQADVRALGLGDGVHEYEFVLDGDRAHPIPDPLATEITRFGGYRGLLRIRGGVEDYPAFDWSDELPEGRQLPADDRLVILALPMRWVEEEDLQPRLGTFDEAAFVHLDRIAELGVNAIELVPVQDSPGTLTRVHATRFFLAPDIDMGTPVEFAWFVKKCHQRGIRVILDIDMTRAEQSPLARLAPERYFSEGESFQYEQKVDGQYWAREYQFEAARRWVEDYRIDGFRIRGFATIDSWEFIQQFRDVTRGTALGRFPDRPFTVISEDALARPVATMDAPTNPNHRRVVDAIWNIGFRDEARRLLLDRIAPGWGEPPRRDRITALVSCRGIDRLTRSVGLVTAPAGDSRLMDHLLAALRQDAGQSHPTAELEAELHRRALERVRSAHALLLTSVAIPMLLAGEEFGDLDGVAAEGGSAPRSVHWYRAEAPGHRETADAVADLVRLRTDHPALHRDEVDIFHFHPTIDLPAAGGGARVFAYCRTAGQPLGSPGQVVVVANAGPQDYPQYGVPWVWHHWRERGSRPGAAPLVGVGNGWADIALAPFEVRVFETW